MGIKPLNSHYSMENPGTIFDEEAMTALELAGRTTSKVNECVTQVNHLTDRVTTHEEVTETRLGKFENETRTRQDNFEQDIRDTVEDIAIDQIQSGALDGIVQKYVNEKTVEDAVIAHTTNIKPERLMANGGEWKSDTPLAPATIHADTIYSYSGFTATSKTMDGVNTAVYNVKPETEYLFTCAQDVGSNEISSGFFIFYGDNTALIGNSKITNFVTKVDNQNHVYRIKTPHGCDQLYARYALEKGVELWETGTTSGLEWLIVDGDNVEAGSITPAHLYRGENRTYYRKVDYVRLPHKYAVTQDARVIQFNAGNGMCALCVSDILPGQKYRIPIGKNVDNVLQNYFCFEEKEGTSAVDRGAIGNFVKCVNTENFIYMMTIPENCTRFYVSFDMADQPEILEVLDGKVHLPWLKVTKDNIADGVQEAGRVLQYINLPYIYGQLGTFSGKTIHVYGDSISAGVTSPNLATTPSPFVHFANWCGATIYNRSVSGATIADIAVQINNVDSFDGVDVIFIAGGINDYRTRVPLGRYGDSTYQSFYGCLKKITDKLFNMNVTANHKPLVVFVTPINYCGDDVGNRNTLDEYREAIYLSAVSAHQGYTVIDGAQMGFPSTYNNLAEHVITDGLHPTELGQTIYAVNLRNLLPM